MRIARPILSTLALLLVVAPVALGHADLDTATPGPGDRITVVPEELVATFTQDLSASRSSMELRDASGAVIGRGGKVATEPREMRMPLPRLEPGEYTVRWTSFSAEDNELHRGSYTFTVLPRPTPTPTPTPTPAPTPAPTPTPRATPTPTSTPTVTPSPSPTPSPMPSPTPEPTPTSPPTVRPSPPPDDTPAADTAAVVIPIAVALVVVTALAGWTLRRRTRP